jgi:hypothetical protein
VLRIARWAAINSSAKSKADVQQPLNPADSTSGEVVKL